MADQKFTRCPGCGTVFRITLAQLALREGQVRCGHCRAVFDANDHFVALGADLRDDDPGLQDELAMGRRTVTLRSADALLPVPAKPDPISERVESRDAEPAKQSVPAEHAVPGAVAVAAIENVSADDVSAPYATADDAIVPEPAAEGVATVAAITDNAVTDGATRHERVADDTTADDTTADDATPGEAMPDDAMPDDATSHERVVDDTTADDATPGEAMPDDAMPDDATADETTADETTADETTADETTADALSADVRDSALAGERLADAEPVAAQASDAAISPPVDVGEMDRAGRFEWKKPRRRGGRSPFVDAIAVVLLLAALALQAVLEFRDALAAHLPVTRPLLAAACGVLGCAVGPLRDTVALSIDASDLQADPAHRGLLLLTATIRNRAAYAIAFPYLELSLTDSSDRVVVRRAFPPSDYAGGTADPGQGIAANGEKLVRLFIDASATAQAGYRLYLFYP